MRPGYIYIIQNLINGKCYVGESWNPELRWKGHRYGRKSGHTPLCHAMVKYGVANFQLSILEGFPSEAEALRVEADLITYFRSIGAELYNVSDGGSGGPSLSGINNPFFGKTHSKETRKRMANSKRGRSLSAEHRQKISAGGRGIKKGPPSAVHLSNMRQAQRSEATCQKKREAMLRTCAAKRAAKLELISGTKPEGEPNP